MKSLVNIIKHRDYDFEKVRFYTLKFEGDKLTLLDQFINNYESDYAESVYYLQWWLDRIGEYRGAKPRYFRHSDNVDYLPPPAESIAIFDSEIERDKMNLRLYGIVLSEEVVILVDGGIKVSQKLRDSPTCQKAFNFASNISSQIRRQKTLGNISLKGKDIILKEGFSLTYQKK